MYAGKKRPRKEQDRLFGCKRAPHLEPTDSRPGSRVEFLGAPTPLPCSFPPSSGCDCPSWRSVCISFFHPCGEGHSRKIDEGACRGPYNHASSNKGWSTVHAATLFTELEQTFKRFCYRPCFSAHHRGLTAGWSGLERRRLLPPPPPPPAMSPAPLVGCDWRRKTTDSRRAPPLLVGGIE